jgi:hypothetical protein
LLINQGPEGLPAADSGKTGLSSLPPNNFPI